MIGGFGSPPCSTVSAARHRPLSQQGGPRPLRSRSDPWIPLKYCSPKEVQAVRIGSLLFLLCLGMLGEIRAHGGWVGLEHPADRHQEPYPSFFNTVEVQKFLRFCGMAYYVMHQCRFGAKSVKPTGLLLPWGCSGIQLKCNHIGGHPPLIGIDHSGRFLTTPAAHYPQGFCQALSDLFVSRLVQVESKGYKLPFAPRPHLNQIFYEPWTQSRHVRWQWPQPSATFLVGELAAYNSFKIYLGALDRLNNDLLHSNLVWREMTESQQDMFVAEWLLDCYESGVGRTEAAWALSALQKIFPRASFRTGWKVLDSWQQQVPPKQAPAAPPEVIHGMIAMALLLNRPHLAGLMLLCYVGLLRVREALSLTKKDVVIDSKTIVLCLGRTKRGMEQRVVLTNAAVRSWIVQFLLRFNPIKEDDFILDLSYSAALRGVKRISTLLGVGELHLTTHTFRRSGASELSKQGMPLSDILLYGRWLSERAARDYIRKGEVAIIRAKQAVKPSDWTRVLRWGSFAAKAWSCYDYMYKQEQFMVDMRQLSILKLAKVEEHLFQS